jgi:hypothetical protein
VPARRERRGARSRVLAESVEFDTGQRPVVGLTMRAGSAGRRLRRRCSRFLVLGAARAWVAGTTIVTFETQH